MSEHEHDWSKRGSKGDPWVRCWLCGEVRNGWLGARDEDRLRESVSGGEA